MTHDDRFFALVCCTAFVITCGVFIATHVDSWSIAWRAARAPSGAERLTDDDADQPAPPGVTVAARPDPPTPSSAAAVVPAILGDGPPPVDVETHARSSRARGVEPVLAALNALAGARGAGHDPWNLPSPREILVRWDRDGRLVIAAGTHRRYAALRDTIVSLTDLDMGAVDASVAHRDLGDDVEERVVQAIDLLLALDVPAVEPDMASRGTFWGFADPGLDDLPSAHRHLLWMGIDNHRAVRSALETLRERLAGSPWVRPPATAGSPSQLAVQIARRDPTATEAVVTEP